MSAPPLDIGEGPAHGPIVARLHLTFEALEWIVNELPWDDAFTRLLRDDLERVRVRVEADKAARVEMPKLMIRVGPRRAVGGDQ